jgi:hypothetical protein
MPTLLGTHLSLASEARTKEAYGRTLPRHLMQISPFTVGLEVVHHTRRAPCRESRHLCGPALSRPRPPPRSSPEAIPSGWTAGWAAFDAGQHRRSVKSISSDRVVRCLALFPTLTRRFSPTFVMLTRVDPEVLRSPPPSKSWRSVPPRRSEPVSDRQMAFQLRRARPTTTWTCSAADIETAAKVSR